MPDRPCATCGRPESEHSRIPAARVLPDGRPAPILPSLGHLFQVKPGDEWCSSCDDWVVNGCGTLADCEQRERDDEIERALDRELLAGWSR